MGDRDLDKRDPARKLVRVLAECKWQPLSETLWRKRQITLHIDEIGIFLYRHGARTHGLSHNRIRPGDLKRRKILFRDGKTLNLLTGEIF